MVTKQDLLELGFVIGWSDPRDSFYDLQSNERCARYFFSVSSGLFEDNMLCILNKKPLAYYNHSEGVIISSKTQLQKLLKLHGF